MDRSFRNMNRIFSFTGIRVYSNERSCSVFWIFVQIYSFLVSFFAFFFCTGFLVLRAKNIAMLMQGMSVWSTCSMLTVTSGTCIVFQKEFRQYLEEMAFVDALKDIPFISTIHNANKTGRRIDELKDLISTSQEKLFKFVNGLIKYYPFVVFLTVTLYICDAGYRIITQEDDGERIFPFGMWFPWSNENIYVYTATFLFQVHAGYICFSAYPGYQITVFILLAQLIRQLRVITFILLNLNELMQELVGQEKHRWQIYCTDVLSQCIKHYMKLKSFNNKLNVICRLWFLSFILFAMLLVCMCAVQIAVMDLSLNMIRYYIQGVSFVIMIFTFCYLGQELENECERLNNAADESWYLYDRRHLIHMLIFKLAISQAMTSYIFGSMSLSAPTFTWFLKMVMSFFTLAMSFFEE